MATVGEEALWPWYSPALLHAQRPGAQRPSADIRDRGAERARLDQVPGYTEARKEAAVEFRLLRQLLEARKRAGLTQEEVALRMGTTRSAISRLEGSRRHLPALSTLRRYADVLGCDVEIQLVPRAPEGALPPPTRA